jgi:FkbM family methyltransferase
LVDDTRSIAAWRKAIRHWRWLYQQSRPWESPTRYLLFHLLKSIRAHEKVSFRYAGARFWLFDTPLTHLMFFHASRWHGARDLRFLRQLLRSGDIIFDVGANVGSHAIPLAKSLGSATQVHAFEPHPRIFGYLKANAALNRLDNLHLYNLALGHQEGEVCFTDLHTDDLNRVLAHPSPETRTLRVAAKRLDSLECAQQPLTLLKIDVEGYERFVLEGAEQTLQRTDFLFIEANAENTAEYGYSVQQLADYLRARGWRLYRLSDEGQLQPLPATPIVTDWENWVGTRAAPLLRERLAPAGIDVPIDDA